MNLGPVNPGDVALVVVDRMLFTILNAVIDSGREAKNHDAHCKDKAGLN